MAQSSSTTLASDTSQTVPQAITQGDFAPPPSAVIALAPHQPQAADQLIQPPPHTLLSSSYPPLEQADWEGMPPLNAAYAVPSIFKPIPIPGEEGLDIGSLDDANGAEALDANSLAAMWCLLEEDKATSSGEVSGIAMGDARNVSWQVEGSQGVEYWPQLDGEWFKKLPGYIVAEHTVQRCQLRMNNPWSFHRPWLSKSQLGGKHKQHNPCSKASTPRYSSDPEATTRSMTLQSRIWTSHIPRHRGRDLRKRVQAHPRRHKLVESIKGRSCHRTFLSHP